MNKNVKIKWACNCCRTCMHLTALNWCRILERSTDYMNVCSSYKPKIITK